DGGPGGAAAIPRNPYAGAWEGTMSPSGGTANAAPASMAMTFSVADVAAQTYSGETTLDGGAPAAHLNVDAPPVAVAALRAAPSGGAMARRTGAGAGDGSSAAALAGGGVVAMRRSADGGPAAAASGPSDGSGLSQLQMGDDNALFVFSAQHTPLLC